ncbi:DUF397 domain-containing protein [Actinomadura sp. GTD37]|uniref:DUF397 domain-containing protein n=1 Tax=Actinomadura sp. GTD37 TaxID=1778030 RepID=UPI0035BF1F08
MDRAVRDDAAWRKSSWSNGSSNCVEVAGVWPGIGVRDSKAPAEPMLVLAPESWTAFIDAIKAGAHDLN